MARAAQKVARGGVSVSITGNVAGVLRSYPTKVAKIARPAARAGILVFYNEMRQRVPVDTGDLYGSIYHYYDTKRSTETRHIYVTGPNKAKAPHWFVVEYGHWLYNQSVGGRWLKSKSNPNARGPGAHDLAGALSSPQWVPAHPYIRPSFGRVSDAIRAAQVRASQRLTEMGSEDD